MYYKIAIDTMIKQLFQTWKTQLFNEYQLVLWPILQDQTTNTHFLGTLRLVIVLTGSISAPIRQSLYHVYHKVLQTWSNGSSVNASPCTNHFVLGETVNTDFSEPNTVAPRAVLLTDFIWTPFHPWQLIYQNPEGSSTPGKPVLPGQVDVLAIYTESNHKYIPSDPTEVVHSAD